MTAGALHPAPRVRDVVLEQLRAVGLALRRPAVAAAALAVLVTLLVTLDMAEDGSGMAFRPHDWILPGLVGLVLPLGVWKGEEPFGATFLWTLPVDRRRHALAKVFAGWVWLMAAIALFMLWLLAHALLSGGGILAEETLRYLPSAPGPGPTAADPAAVRTVRWTPDPLLWLVPFTSATAMYLIASALMLGATVRWIVGSVIALLLLVAAVAAAGELTGSERLIFAPSRALRTFLYGPYGLAQLLAAGGDFLAIQTTLPTGETVRVGRGVPDTARWATATLLWTGVGAAVLWASVSRHRESRRP